MRVVVVRPTLALARALAHADDRWAGAVDGIGRGVAAGAPRLARVDDAWVDGAVRGLARRVRQAGSLARRPQTGLLHQYYLQAVALVATGIALVVVVR